MQMDKSEIYELLCRHLAEVFAPHGFELQEVELPCAGGSVRAGEFIRAAGEVAQRVSIPLAVHALEFDWSLVFDFRSESAEAIYQMFAPVPPKSRSRTRTCGFNLETLVPGLGEWIVVRHLQDIQQSVTQLAPILVRDVLPLLDSHRDLASLDDLMNSSHRHLFPHPAQPNHSMKSLIVAHLARNAELHRLIAGYRGQLKVGGELLAMYDRLAEYLTRAA
jgi:hypothetical protein